LVSFFQACVDEKKFILFGGRLMPCLLPGKASTFKD